MVYLEQAQPQTEEAEKLYKSVLPFRIADVESARQWQYEIWPQIEDLLKKTWPDAAKPWKMVSMGESLMNDGAVVLLMRDQKDKIIGTSFLHELAPNEFTSKEAVYPKDGKTAYNHTVMIDPQLRGQKLMVPLIETTLQEAADLGYDYMLGHYNNRVKNGIKSIRRPDGQKVQKGFAQRILEHDWQNGTIIPPTFPVILRHGPFRLSDKTQHIVFKLHK